MHVQVEKPGEDDGFDGLEKDVLHEVAHQWIGNYIGKRFWFD